VVSLGALRAPLIANKARDSVRQSPCIATCSRSPSIIIDLYWYCSAWCRATDDICSISEQIRSFSVRHRARRACCCIYGTYRRQSHVASSITRFLPVRCVTVMSRAARFSAENGSSVRAKHTHTVGADL